jgi:hypothetical protein
MPRQQQPCLASNNDRQVGHQHHKNCAGGTAEIYTTQTAAAQTTVHNGAQHDMTNARTIDTTSSSSHAG